MRKKFDTKEIWLKTEGILRVRLYQFCTRTPEARKIIQGFPLLHRRLYASAAPAPNLFRFIIACGLHVD